MKTRWNRALNLVLEIRHRDQGKAIINGQERQWDEGDFLICIPLENTKGQLYKYPILPEKYVFVKNKLENVSWGCLIQLEFQGRYVSDIEILDDWLTDFYEAETVV